MNEPQIIKRYEPNSEGYVLVRLACGRVTEEHRVIMSQVMGRALHTHEIVRHIDGNRSNNDISNLMLDHRGENGAAREVELVCCHCKRVFRRRASLVNLSIRRGQTRFCCGRQCVGAVFGRKPKN